MYSVIRAFIFFIVCSEILVKQWACAKYSPLWSSVSVCRLAVQQLIPVLSTAFSGTQRHDWRTAVAIHWMGAWAWGGSQIHCVKIKRWVTVAGQERAWAGTPMSTRFSAVLGDAWSFTIFWWRLVRNLTEAPWNSFEQSSLGFLVIQWPSTINPWPLTAVPTCHKELRG